MAKAQAQVEVAPRKKAERKSLPAYLPLDERVQMPASEACPDCGGKLKQLGEACRNSWNNRRSASGGELYVMEDGIRGKPPDERCSARQQHAKPLLDELERRLHATLATLLRKSDTAAAILYSLNLWPALTRYRDDGRIDIDNSAAERALRGVALGRRNFLGRRQWWGTRWRHVRANRNGQT